MDYEKQNWIDHIEDSETGEVFQEGTLFTAKRMNHIEEGIYQASSQIKDIENKLTVNFADFGAVGDGITDDTEALQNAINYCIENGKNLEGISGKVYLITNSLNIVNNINIDFKNSTLLTNNNINMIEFNYPSGTKNQGYLKNIVIDMNNIAQCGIHATRVVKKLISNIEIKNISKVGFDIEDGFEVIFENSHLYGSSSNSIGLIINTTDCHFKDIILIDLNTALKTYGTNLYQRIHAWNKTPEITKNSVFFEANAGTSILSQCYSDTYVCAFQVNSYSRIKLDQHSNFINEEYMPTDIIDESGGYIYMFKYENTLASQYTSITNSSLQGYKSNSSKALYTNIEYDDNRQFLDSQTRVEFFNDNFGCNKFNLETLMENQNTLMSLTSGYDNFVFKQGYVNQICMRLITTDNIAENTNTVIGKLPLFLRPLSELCISVPYTTRQDAVYQLNDTGLLRIKKDGEIHFYNKSAINVNSWIVINATYISLHLRP